MYPRPQIVRTVAETLESRRLLADSITIFRDGSGIMWINRNGVSVPMADNTVNGSAGNDTIRVDSTGGNMLVINPAAGADTVIIATNGDLDDLGAGGVYVNDGTDALIDTLEIRDYADGGNDTYEFSELVITSRTKLIKPDLPGNESEFVEWDPLRYAVILKTNTGSSTVTLPNTVTMDATGESITIDDSQGNGGSFVEFRSRLEDPAAFAVVGGTGNDTLDFLEMGANFGSIDFSFDAGGGTDTLLMRGNGDTITVDASDATYTDTTGNIAFDWTNLEHMRLETSGNATFNVTGAIGTEPNTTLVGDSGVDTFNIGSGAIANVNSPITIDGDNGVDNVVINDSSSSTGKTINFDSATFSYTGGDPITLIDAEYVTILGGTGNDTITLGTNLAATFRLEVNAGSGNDTINATPHDSTDLFLHGGSPTISPGDSLVLTRGGATNGRLSANGAGFDIDFDDRESIYFEGFETSPAPAIAPAAPDLLSADDSGQSSTDNYTNDTSARFVGNVGVANATVRLFRSGVSIGSAVSDASGDYTVTGNFTAGDTTAPITVTYQGPFAVVRSNVSAALSVRVDTIAPAAPTSAPDLLITSDSGASAIDDWTNDNTPTFATTSAERVRLFEGTNVLADYAASGNVTALAMSDGAFTITYRAVDLAGNQSAASPSLLIGIDTNLPPAPAAPDLLALNDYGPFNDDNITNDNAPSFSVSTSGSAPYVRIFVDGVQLSGNYELKEGAQAVGLNDGIRSITARAVDAAGNVSVAAGPPLQITVDTVQPSLTTPATFNFNGEFTQPHSLTYLFSEDVSASLAPADWTVTNATTAATFTPTVAYNASLNRALLRFPTVTTLGIAGMLPDGNYTSFFNRNNITDVAGNVMDSNSNRSFFVLMADADRDRSVDFDDLLMLAQNYGQTGRTFSQGNFSYSADGVVNFDDLLLLAQRYGTSLAAPLVGSQPGLSSTTRRRSNTDLIG